MIHSEYWLICWLVARKMSSFNIKIKLNFMTIIFDGSQFAIKHSSQEKLEVNCLSREHLRLWHCCVYCVQGRGPSWRVGPYVVIFAGSGGTLCR